MTLNTGLSLCLFPSWNINGTRELSRKHEGGRQEERHPIQRRVTILLVLSHYGNQGKYRHPIGQLAHVLGILDKKLKLREGGCWSQSVMIMNTYYKLNRTFKT